MRIGPFDLTKKVFIVAEIGNNHEGDFDLALRLIELAAGAGVDAVKFQTLRADKLVSPKDRERFERLRRFELTFEQFEQLADRANLCNLLFLSTPFDMDSATFLSGLCPALKIASGDNNFIPLLRHVAKFRKPILLSTGAANLDRVSRAKETIEQEWQKANPGLVLLHCVSAYPTPPEQANLAAIHTLRDTFNCEVGYSDHTLGIDAAIVAAAQGARVIEKHFTLDKAHSSFRDHQLSADPDEMAHLVQRIRQVETLLGDGVKRIQPSEIQVEHALQRRIVAARSIASNTRIDIQHLNWVRGSEGLPAGKEHLLIGRVTRIPIDEGQLFALEHFESGN